MNRRARRARKLAKDRAFKFRQLQELVKFQNESVIPACEVENARLKAEIYSLKIELRKIQEEFNRRVKGKDLPGSILVQIGREPWHPSGEVLGIQIKLSLRELMYSIWKDNTVVPLRRTVEYHMREVCHKLVEAIMECEGHDPVSR